jgi:hypothetical protein
MEDVLEVYQRPRDPERPVVCLDETSKQMIVETREPIAAKPGRKVRHDYEYARNGVANLFMMFAPLEGWRHVKVTDHHAAIDYAHALKDLSDTHFPDAAKIVLVQDNLSTHKPASLYEAFPASEARRLAERFEWHYTPKHGSWLDMAESELGVLSTQCLDRRFPDKQTLTSEIAAWEADRNTHHAKAQGNRVKNSCDDEACEEVVVPSGDFAAEADGILAWSSSDQVEGHMLDGGEVGGSVIGADAAFVVAEIHVHDPVKAVLDHPMGSDSRPELGGDP